MNRNAIKIIIYIQVNKLGLHAARRVEFDAINVVSIVTQIKRNI